MFRSIKPPALKEESIIAVVSPASAEKSERFDSAKKRLEKLGFLVKEGGHARLKNKYFAGTDEERAADFNAALKDESVSAIFAARGGYGCSRLLSRLDYDSAKRNPKIILGGSDLTVLLWAIHQRTGLYTFFGPMALEIGRGLEGFSARVLWKILSENIIGEFTFPPEHHPYSLKPGTARGRLIGGCLSLVVSLLGTEYFGDVSGRLLFLEEIGEKPFRIDRMLTHLRNAGVFNKISGLMLGDFHQCWEGDDGESLQLREIIEQVLEDVNIPVMAGLPFGHGKLKMTLPLGIKAEMDADEGRLIFLEGAVEDDG